MNQKKVGGLLILLSLTLGGILLVIMNEFYEKNLELGCFQNPACKEVESSLSISHLGIGVLSFILALGFYMVVFNKGEEEVLKRLEEEKNKQVQKDKFSIMLKMLNANEQTVLRAIKEQDGITQSTLVFRTGLSRSMVSEILKSFEAKNIIKKKKTGKTYSLHILEVF